ncbi:hypothetical protein YPPY66_3324, partial [Yersinia pestis PY-66]
MNGEDRQRSKASA